MELPLSAVSLSGSYCMGLEVRWGDKVIAAEHGRFEVLRSQVAVTPILPEVFRLGLNEVGFRLVNMGKVDVGSGVLDVRLKDPRGGTVWVGEIPFSLRVGEEALLGASVSLSSLVFGTYSLSYAQRDETGSRVPFHRHTVNRGQLSASLDRGSYHVRQVAALRVDVQDLGSFAWDGALLEVSVEEMGLTQIQELSLQAGQLRTIELPIPIGEATSSGRHKVDVTLKISPEASLLASRSFLVPASRLVLGSSGGPVLAPGDVITLTLRNTGGVDTTYRTERLRVTDLQGTVIWDGGLSGSLRSMEEKTLVAIQIPRQAATGKATLEVVLRDEGRGGRCASLGASRDSGAWGCTRYPYGARRLLGGRSDIGSYEPSQRPFCHSRRDSGGCGEPHCAHGDLRIRGDVSEVWLQQVAHPAHGGGSGAARSPPRRGA
ncbi:MAG: hypothetical protein ACUVXD_14295 [Thermodesulfobacteriota bacterium]